MGIIFGSARIDENGRTSGGNVGDQTGNEVSTQTGYMHSKGWYALRPKNTAHATAIANKMKHACDNNNIGYDQGNRLGIMKYGINTATKTECDCSSLVRRCVLEATGVDCGNFTTATECSMLENSGLFDAKFSVSSLDQLYDGDVLVTKTKGHTVIVVSGRQRNTNQAPSNNVKVYNGVKQVYSYHVRDLQGALNDDGMRDGSGNKLSKDGIYGQKTEESLLSVGSKISTRGKLPNTTAWVQCRTGANVDGDYGSKTREAVRVYQNKKGLSEDGVAGVVTIREIVKDCVN